MCRVGASLSFPGSCYPQRSERHQGGRRTNWELALHLGQFINWIMGNLRPQANPKEALLLPLVYGENIRHKELRARFYLVFQELGLFKQVIEHCLASISPSIQWLGSSHPPGLSELSWELHEMMGISRFLLGLICLG